MRKIDRYMLSQLLILFGFFSLVLVAVFWINQAVVLFDRLIGDGQSALVFLEFTALGLPRLVTTILPISAFAASVYVTNRMNNESELTVMQATGWGPYRLARPVLAFGVVVFLMASALHHALLPLALQQLSEREAEISQNATSRLLTEGTFLHPSRAVTFYAREINEDGILNDVFLSDRRKPEEGVIYTAAEAYLLRDQNVTTLIMLDGMAQRLSSKTNRLSTARFRDFSFDISALVRGDPSHAQRVRNMTTLALMTSWRDVSAQTGQRVGDIAEEFHNRFAEPFFCVVAAMIGFTTLLVGGYSRFGVWREIGVAFGLLLLIDGLGSTLQNPVRAEAQRWPVLYLPAALGAVLATGMLAYLARPRWLRRKRATNKQASA
ncbi:LPS export ABC transporter permease LptF [Roseobacter cerasinus]|uniref:LPS export ABC transporter permease LptF n=1 Tax=Roseobacter cerasinus TaxID=2602289 RepID=A0A640VTP4_9RHOB|nr:LPS export ABC transporter permease LptF [Roseobacter cerasinus]GFE51758.1 LPS export ABC transporter permease LptF [Roseobacter cerasinus]